MNVFKNKEKPLRTQKQVDESFKNQIRNSEDIKSVMTDSLNSWNQNFTEKEEKEKERLERE